MLAVSQGDFQLMGVFNNVIVCKDVALVVNNQAGPGSLAGDGLVEEIILDRD
jgi:hypothetical protein